MIELGDKIEVYDVMVCATIGVHREIRVRARSDAHAREVAKQTVNDDEGFHDWLFPPTGQMINVGPDSISSLLTGMCPKKITPDALDRDGNPLFVGDDVTYEYRGKLRTVTINDVFDGQKMLWCDDNLFSISVDEVRKA